MKNVSQNSEIQRVLRKTLMSHTPLLTVDFVVNESLSVRGDPRGQLLGDISTLCKIKFSVSSAIVLFIFDQLTMAISPLFRDCAIGASVGVTDIAAVYPLAVIATRRENGMPLLAALKQGRFWAGGVVVSFRVRTRWFDKGSL